MALQGYYVLISIYGWYLWLSGNHASKNTELKISRLTRRTGVYLLLITLAMLVSIWIILTKYTDSTTPFADAFATALSIVATWMLARKIIEHWLVWIFVDLFSIGLFWYKSLIPTAILFSIYAIMAVLGFFEWRRSINFSKNTLQN